jgi:hypothetical protein
MRYKHHHTKKPKTQKRTKNQAQKVTQLGRSSFFETAIQSFKNSDQHLATLQQQVDSSLETGCASQGTAPQPAQYRDEQSTE